MTHRLHALDKCLALPHCTKLCSLGGGGVYMLQQMGMIVVCVWPNLKITNLLSFVLGRCTVSCTHVSALYAQMHHCWCQHR